MADQKVNTTSGQAQVEEQTIIKWDDTNMQNTYCNVSNVAAGREEVVILFGMNQSWHSGQKEVKVQLSNRMLMSPFAAKRLSILLNNVLEDYEKRYGKLDAGVKTTQEDKKATAAQ